MDEGIEARDWRPPARTCGSYTYGHDVHFIQARLTWEEGRGRPCRIVSVADVGTIWFADGTTRWNHDPARLRAVVARSGADASLGTHGVLRVPRDGGACYFSVGDDVDPCRPETAEARPGESIVDEVLRRGGLVRSVRAVVDGLEQRGRSPQ